MCSSDLCVGFAVAGVVNALVAAVQVFAPGWPDGDWLAISGIPGRAVGNLRQPNHLSSLLTWSAVAVVALTARGRLPWRWAAACGSLILLGVVLSASRTGTLSVLILALWGLVDRRLPRPARALLVLAPRRLWAGMGWHDVVGPVVGSGFWRHGSIGRARRLGLAVWHLVQHMGVDSHAPMVGRGIWRVQFRLVTDAFPGTTGGLF